MQVKWTPIKNTERGAISRLGEWWTVVSTTADDKIMIQDSNAVDLRWINRSQVKEERKT